MTPLLRGLLIVGLAGLTGCSGLGFDTTVGGDGEIPGLLVAPGQQFSNFSASASLQQSFDTNGTSASHITSAKVTGGTLSVTNPTAAQDTLQYISSFDISVSATGLPDVTVATIPSSAFGSAPTSVNLTANDVELQPYVASGSITMTPNVTFGSRPMQPVAIHLSVNLHIVAKP